MTHIKIITTADGSHSLVNMTLNETYHSVHGAIQESEHVFIRNGLEFLLTRTAEKKIRILEIGFGTGLNALLSLLSAKRLSMEIYYESWEAHPLGNDVIKQLNYGKQLSADDSFLAIHHAEWNMDAQIDPSFTIHKRKGDILIDEITGGFDLVFYDAFAPVKQPEMWTYDLLAKVTGLLNPSGVYVTYCARGQVKRDLATMGLKVETLEGPPGKKEMIRALKG